MPKEDKACLDELRAAFGADKTVRSDKKTDMPEQLQCRNTNRDYYSTAVAEVIVIGSVGTSA